MKKCKVTLSSKTKKRFFYLAPDAETLYFLSLKTNKKNIDSLLKTHPSIETVSINYDEFVEIEWNGCQNIFDGLRTTKMNYVRLIKASHGDQNTMSDSLISVHFGWIFSDNLKFTNHKKSGVRVKMLSTKDDQFNFDELFQDNETIEDMIKKTEILDLS